VVERRNGESRIERSGRLVELVQRHRPNICSGCAGVDRNHLVADACKCASKTAVAGTDLE